MILALLFLPFTDEDKVLFVDDNEFVFMIVVVDTSPFTFEVNVFTLEDKLFVVVDDNPEIDVVATIPFIVLVSMPPE